MLSLLAAPPATAAQEPVDSVAAPTPAESARLDSLLSSLRPGKPIRVQAIGAAERTDGAFLSYEEERLRFGRAPTWELPADSVARLWTRGSAVKTGAIVGGVAGAAVLGTFLGVVVEALCETEECGTAGAVALGALVGGAAGAGAGALIGLAIPVWRLRFP